MKRFFAKDMRTALLEVKEVLGADAVIMSSKKVAGGIEIMAGIDDDQMVPQPQKATTPPRALDDDQVSLSGLRQKLAKFSATKEQKQIAEEPADDSLQALLKRQQKLTAQPETEAMNARTLNPAFAEASASAMPAQPQLSEKTQQEIESLKEEMQVMRQLLEHQVSGLMKKEMDRSEPIRAMLVKQLAQMGLDEQLADQFACYIGDVSSGREAWKKLQDLLVEQLVVTDDEILRLGGVVALVGPTGVGKTTTIAKIAARFVAQYGADQVALISCDSYRIGAVDQLSTYGRILGCPVRSAKNPQELSEQLQQLKHRKLILIDTAGMSQRDMRLNEQLNTLIANSRVKIKSYLVLPATAQRVVMQEAIEQFRRIPLRGCIFTKLDECLSLGECISVAIQNALPIGYLSDGQRVPEDLRVADANYLVRQALSLVAERRSKGAGRQVRQTEQLRL